jgi:hypothetical protein
LPDQPRAGWKNGGGSIADPQRNRTRPAGVVKIVNDEGLFAINERAAGVASDIEP